VGNRSRGRYATPAGFPRHDGTPYWGLRIRQWGLGVVHRSRAIFCRAVPNPNDTIRNFCIAVGEALVAAATSGSAQFFLGTDSAPHAKGAKENACGCAGCFSAHAALPLYAHAFEEVRPAMIQSCES
jgi:hypothetical protein